MKIASLVLLGVLAIVLVSGCTETGELIEKPVCNLPYIIHGTGCCLDRNDNDICDEDEALQTYCGDNVCDIDENCSSCPQDCNSCTQYDLPEEQKPTIEQQEQRRCPSSCDDGYKCTHDYCSFDTNFECIHNQLMRCCGNGVCENTDECVNCFSDCYTCQGHYCSAVSGVCEDRELYVFTTFDDIRVEVPTDYVTEAVWFGDIESKTLQTIIRVYGFGPKVPITYRFVEFDLSTLNYLYNPQNNKIVIPANSDEPGLLTLRKYYEESQDRELLEVHEMVHAINLANCEHVSYSPVGEEHIESKLPQWTEEGLAMMMEIWILNNYGNEYDRIESRYEPQRESTITSFEDKSSNFWRLVDDPSAYGYEHARGSVLLYSWFKYGITEQQIKSFVSGLFDACKKTDDKIGDSEIIKLWNMAVDRDDTVLFKEVGIIDKSE